jgi:hypothetical protein
MSVSLYLRFSLRRFTACVETLTRCRLPIIALRQFRQDGAEDFFRHFVT